MPVPPLNLALSTGPQMARGLSGGTFSPYYGDGFFGQGGSQSSVGVQLDTMTLLLLAGAGALVWLIATGKVKL